MAKDVQGFVGIQVIAPHAFFPHGPVKPHVKGVRLQQPSLLVLSPSIGILLVCVLGVGGLGVLCGGAIFLLGLGMLGILLVACRLRGLLDGHWGGGLSSRRNRGGCLYVHCLAKPQLVEIRSRGSFEHSFNMLSFGHALTEQAGMLLRFQVLGGATVQGPVFR